MASSLLPASLLLLLAPLSARAETSPSDPVARGGVGIGYYTDGTYTVTIESQDPSLRAQTARDLLTSLFESYPREAQFFNPDAPRALYVTVYPTLDCGFADQVPACAYENNISINGAWMRSYPEDYDLIAHEAMHVVQWPGGPDCGYWVEGYADLARAWFGINNRAAGWALDDPAPGESYTAAYRVTAKFLDWIARTYGADVVYQGNLLLVQGQCPSRTFWEPSTKMDVDQLWSAYLRTL